MVGNTTVQGLLDMLTEDQRNTLSLRWLHFRRNCRKARRGDPASKDLGRVPFSASLATWRNVWTLYAAGILLFIELGVSAYQVGIHKGRGNIMLESIITPVLGCIGPESVNG
jgi:hypothetical protein